MKEKNIEKTLAQHNLKYDHAQHAELAKRYDAKKHSLSIGSVHLEEGLYDTEGFDLSTLKHYHDFELLPDGNADAREYWQALKSKIYWYDYNQCNVSGLPSSYGMVNVYSNSYSDVYVTYKQQPSGSLFWRSMNVASITPWRQVYDSINFPIGDGTWTPSLVGDTVAGSYVYDVRQGEYYRQGNFVFVNFKIIVHTINTAPTGSFLIDGLPFASRYWQNVIPLYSCSGMLSGMKRILGMQLRKGYQHGYLRMMDNSGYLATATSSLLPLTVGTSTNRIYLEGGGGYAII